MNSIEKLALYRKNRKKVFDTVLVLSDENGQMPDLFTFLNIIRRSRPGFLSSGSSDKMSGETEEAMLKLLGSYVYILAKDKGLSLPGYSDSEDSISQLLGSYASLRAQHAAISLPGFTFNSPDLSSLQASLVSKGIIPQFTVDDLDLSYDDNHNAVLTVSQESSLSVGSMLSIIKAFFRPKLYFEYSSMRIAMPDFLWVEDTTGILFPFGKYFTSGKTASNANEHNNDTVEIVEAELNGNGGTSLLGAGNESESEEARLFFVLEGFPFYSDITFELEPAQQEVPEVIDEIVP